DRCLDAQRGKIMPGFMEALGGMQQRLGGDAADVQAGAAEAAALVDAGGGEAQLSGPDGGVVAAGAAADHDHVERVSHARSSALILAADIMAKNEGKNRFSRKSTHGWARL